MAIGTSRSISRSMSKIGLMACLALIVLSSATFGAGIDIQTNYPQEYATGFATQGANGFWASAYQPGRTPANRLLTPYAYDTVFGTPDQLYGIALVEKFNHDIILAPSSAFGSGTVYGAEWAVLSYQVPTAGTYVVAGAFLKFAQYLGTADSPVSIFIDDAYQTPVWSGIADVNNTLGIFAATTPMLAEGSFIRFAAAAPVDGQAGGNTWLGGNITKISSVPEPSSLASMAVAMIGALSLLRRRRS